MSTYLEAFHEAFDKAFAPLDTLQAGKTISSLLRQMVQEADCESARVHFVEDWPSRDPRGLVFFHSCHGCSPLTGHFILQSHDKARVCRHFTATRVRE